jgi:hypothetical protein
MHRVLKDIQMLLEFAKEEAEDGKIKLAEIYIEEAKLCTLMLTKGIAYDMETI